MTGIAIVGTGSITQKLAEALREVGGFEVVGVVSRNLDRGAAAARAMGARQHWPDLPTMLEHSAVEAVCIATPNSLHFSQSLAAVAAGRHVFVEKPATTSEADFVTLETTASAAGVVVFEGMRNVYDPGLQEIRELLPELGPIRQVRLICSRRSARYDAVLAKQRVNIFDPAMGGGALFDLGVYPISALVALFGEPQAVSAAAVGIETGADGAGTALATYPGFVADVSYSKITTSTSASEIQGESGTLYIDDITAPRDLRLEFADGSQQRRLLDLPSSNLRFEVKRFADLIAGRGDSSPDRDRTRLTLRFCDAVRQATAAK